MVQYKTMLKKAKFTSSEKHLLHLRVSQMKVLFSMSRLHQVFFLVSLLFTVAVAAPACTNGKRSTKKPDKDIGFKPAKGCPGANQKPLDLNKPVRSKPHQLFPQGMRIKG
jgi:hypothetical protein